MDRTSIQRAKPSRNMKSWTVHRCEVTRAHRSVWFSAVDSSRRKHSDSPFLGRLRIDTDDERRAEKVLCAVFSQPRLGRRRRTTLFQTTSNDTRETSRDRIGSSRLCRKSFSGENKTKTKTRPKIRPSNIHTSKRRRARWNRKRVSTGSVRGNAHRPTGRHHQKTIVTRRVINSGEELCKNQLNKDITFTLHVPSAHFVRFPFFYVDFILTRETARAYFIRCITCNSFSRSRAEPTNSRSFSLPPRSFFSRISPGERRRFDVFFFQTNAQTTSQPHVSATEHRKWQDTLPATARSLVDMAYRSEGEILQPVGHSIAARLDRSMGVCDDRLDPSTHVLREREAQHHVSFLHIRIEELPRDARQRAGGETATERLGWAWSERVSATTGTIRSRSSSGETGLRRNQSTGVESNRQSVSIASRWDASACHWGILWNHSIL